MKQLRSKLYTETRIHYADNEIQLERDPNNYLFSKGRYPTKILADDLPEWYVYGCLYKRHGFISAKGVKHLVYVPDYTSTNHLHTYDSLFVSYDAEIELLDAAELPLYTGYDYMLSGPIIMDFILAVKQYSDCDISDVLSEIEKKNLWFQENNEKETKESDDT